MSDRLSVGSLQYMHALEGSAISGTVGFLYGHNRYENPLIDLESTNKTRVLQEVISWRSIQPFAKYQWKLELRHHYETALSDNLGGEVDRNRLMGLAVLHAKLTSRFKASVYLRAEKTGDFFSGIRPSGGLVYRVHKYWDVKINAAMNSRMPTLNELYWQPGGESTLQPEQGYMAEAGLAYDRTEKLWKAQASLIGYYGFSRNWIVWLPGPSFWSPRNLRNVNTIGLEGKFMVQIKWHKWDLSLNGNWRVGQALDRAEEKDLPDNQVIYVPMVQGMNSIVVKRRSFSFRAELPFTGKYFIATDNSGYMPAYGYFNAAFGKRFSFKKISLNLWLRTNNLTNWQYQIVPNRPAPGRHYVVSLNIKWL